MILNKKRNKKPYIIFAAVIIALIGTYLAIAYYNQLPPFLSNVEPSPRVGEQKINLERSEAEKQAIKNLEGNPDLKTQNNQTDTPDTPSEAESGKMSVNVLLTNVSVSNGTVSVSGFVTNLAEENGACSYVFTNGSSTVSKKVATLTNPTSTTCETIKFPANELPVEGNWGVVIKYSSASAIGESNKKEFTR